ncbi:MAG: DMT family transporter, partial [Eubacteriales bacterium]|nr:DMT family transporter [Eubacteriales bacterium]
MLKKLMRDDRYYPFFALFCALGWSLAYPFIKLGYGEFQIAQSDLGSKVLFAGIRFLFAGILVLLFVLLRRHHLSVSRKSPWGLLLLFGLVNTALHYLFAYVGLSYLPSSRSTILDSMNGFLLILMSCMIFADDHMSLRKALGCILGFAGIVLINLEPGEAMLAGISLRGDGLVLLNAFFGALGGLLTRVVSKKMDMTTATGISMTAGGGMLCLTAFVIGPSETWNITMKGIGILLVLILISASCFGVYNLLLSYHPISKIASETIGLRLKKIVAIT